MCDTTKDPEDEYDTSSDEEVEVEGADRSESLPQREIGISATFLLGTWSRFGRVVCLNNRLLYWGDSLSARSLVIFWYPVV